MEIYVSEYNGKMVAVLLDDEMKIVKPVYDFLRFQQQKGRAINTLKAYGTDLCLLWTFLKKNGYAYDQVTPRLIAEFIDYLRGGDEMLSLYRESVRSNRTINRILSTVRKITIGLVATIVLALCFWRGYVLREQVPEAASLSEDGRRGMFADVAT